MPRAARNTVSAKAESIRKKIKDQVGLPACQWRVEGHDGLTLVTYPTGAGVWWFIYRLRLDKQRKIKIGDIENVTLAQAIQRAHEHRAEVGRGDNPQLAVHKGITFQQLAERCLKEHPSLAASTRRNYEYSLKADVFPEIGKKVASAVSADDVAAICRKIKAKGKIVHAQRVKTTIGGVYSWGIRETLVKTNPAKSVPNQQTIKSVRNRLPADDELRRLWRALDAAPRLSTSIALVIKLTIITGLRRKEVAGARIDEFEGDVWTIRGDIAKAGRIVDEGRMKSGREQVVYLSRQARALFDEARATCANDEFVFPADPLDTAKRSTELPYINSDSVTRAMRRICDDAGIEDLHLHDMRTAMVSFLDEAEVQESIQSALLHHTPQDVTSVHYRRSKREDRMRAAWQLWADHVETVVNASANEQPTPGSAAPATEASPGVP
jgi:integrase